MTDPVTSWAQPEGPSPSTGPTPGAPMAGPGPVSPAPIIAPRKSGSGRATNILLAVAALIAVGGLAFAGGRVTAPASASGFQGARGGFPTGSFDPNRAGGPGFGQGGPGGDRAITITGTVKSLDGSSLVITAADGAETTIDVSGSTYHMQAAASASDVTAGSTVSVTVIGFGGFRGPDASAPPNGGAGSTAIKASDVTITGK